MSRAFDSHRRPTPPSPVGSRRPWRAAPSWLELAPAAIAGAEDIDPQPSRDRLAGDDAVARRHFDPFMPAPAKRALAEARGELEIP